MLRADFSSFRRYSKFLSTRNQLCIALLSRQAWSRTIVALGALGVLALAVGCGATNAVSSTTNPQMALYVYQARTTGSVKVEFGPTTAYGFETAPLPVPPGGSPMRILVAGMKANTLYHMRAVATYSNGTTATDSDHTFTTGSYPAGGYATLPPITATTSPGQTPQPGIEILDGVAGPTNPLIATDLSGNVIWAYVASPIIASPAILQAPKLLPNGDFVFIIGPNSSFPVVSPAKILPTTPDLIREIDLLGNTVEQLTISQLNQELAAANYNLTLQTFHHDVTPLPNGHLLVLANTLKSVVLTGQTTPTQVLGDVVIDLDTNLNPVWVWNSFDHLDVNRRGWEFPDWNHTNAIVYSKDDGNILISMRAQNWVLKIDYNNGAGTGNIIWHLGEGGDFTLQGGVDPTDWFYAQHGPAFTSTNTTGIFGLTLMDNGDDRTAPNGTPFVACGGAGGVACYSTVPIFQINETTMTATLTFHQVLPANLYNSFGGNAQTLDNGNVEYDLCGLGGASPHSQVSEVTTTQNPQSVFNLTVGGIYIYRGYRLPSLYPGVQW